MTDTSQPRSTARIVVAAGLLAFVALYLYAAFGFSFGSWNNPRAGFLPRIAGVLGLFLALGNLATVIISERQSADFGAKPLRAVLFTLGLIGYVPLLSVAGFMPSTGLLTLYLFKIYGAKGWIVPILVSAITAVAVFFLFSRLLQLPLP